MTGTQEQTKDTPQTLSEATKPDSTASETPPNETSEKVEILKSQTHFTLGGKRCTLFNDEHFIKIRQKYGISLNFAPDPKDFNFDNLKPGGGKGGDPLGFTSDKDIIIKQMNPGDHNCLLSLASELCCHVSSVTQNSLLVPILCHFEVEKLQFLAMKNCLKLQNNRSFHKVYDLKGCADDKLLQNEGKKVPEIHKRFYNLLIWFNLMCSPLRKQQRKTYFKGKLEALHHPYIPLTKQQKQEFMKSINYDITFLKKHKLMDYSLLVGVAHSDITENEVIHKFQAGQGMKSVDGSKGRETMFSIIDFLQVWGVGKEVAKCVKTLEHNKATVPPEKYGDRFVSHFETFIVPVDSEDKIKAEQALEKANKLMGKRCFPFEKA